MKTSNRARQKSKATTKSLQPQTKGNKSTAEKPVSYELSAAMLCLDENYKRASAMRLYEANSYLSHLYLLTRHHPQLKRETAALRLIGIGVGKLDRYLTLSREIRSGTFFGKESFNNREWHALMWFADYYNATRELPFVEAVEKLSGFEPWIPIGSTSSLFQEIAGAILDIIIGKSGMAALARKVNAL